MNNYFSSAKDVMFLDPIDRLLSKIFGPERIVMKCTKCGKIPTTLYSGKCLTCSKKEE